MGWFLSSTECHKETSKMSLSHRERHRTERISWLRATVLGANDGIVLTASLVLGVAAAQATHGNFLVAGVAGLAAGAMSMAAGEYVSVHSQADTEQADLALERKELRLAPGQSADQRAKHYNGTDAWNRISIGIPKYRIVEYEKALISDKFTVIAPGKAHDTTQTQQYSRNARCGANYLHH
jgi:VIT family